MSKITELIKSRKFWGAVTAAVLAVWGFFEGKVTAEFMIAAIIVVIGFWQNAQSRVDASKPAGQ